MSSIITLTEGSPWGFKMIGGKDFHLPLTIGKVSQELHVTNYYRMIFMVQIIFAQSVVVDWKVEYFSI